MRLEQYLQRIGFEGVARPNLETLTAIQRGHHLAIAYENLDVQLGRPVSTDPDAAVDKLVGSRRGGWCYEMNGVMGWALREIGFSVTRLAGAAMRSTAGPANEGNHLVLRVDLDERSYIADVGLGDGPLSPYPIRDGPFVQDGLNYRLEALEDGWWRLHNHALARPPNFDVRLDEADEALLARKCAWLGSDPASIFVQTLICQRFTPRGHIDLIGRVFRQVGPRGVSERLLQSSQELIAVLGDEFGIQEPAVASLWPAIVARHEAVFAQASSSMSQ
jgi:N-hydroxyarylamine O-acetyltransferase